MQWCWSMNLDSACNSQHLTQHWRQHDFIVCKSNYCVLLINIFPERCEETRFAFLLGFPLFSHSQGTGPMIGLACFPTRLPSHAVSCKHLCRYPASEHQHLVYPEMSLWGTEFLLGLGYREGLRSQHCTPVILIPMSLPMGGKGVLCIL